MPSSPLDELLQGVDPMDAATLFAGVRNTVPLSMLFRSGELNTGEMEELAKRRGPATIDAPRPLSPDEVNRRAQMDFEMQYPDPKIRQMLIDEMLKQSRNPYSPTTATRRRDFEEAPIRADQFMSAAPKKKKFADGGTVGTGAKFTVDGRPIDHSLVSLSEYQNAQGQPHTNYEGLNYDAAGGSRINTPGGEMYFSPYAAQPTKEKLDWLTSQPTTESLNAMSPMDRKNALESWQKSQPGYVDPMSFDTFEEYIGAANPTYRVGKDAGNDLQNRANFYGLTTENYQNALSKNPSKPMGVNQAEYGSELLSPVERLAAETARGYGIGPANTSQEFQDLIAKNPSVFDRAFAVRSNWLGKNYPTVGQNFPKANPLRKYANGGAIDFTTPDMADGGRFIPDAQPFNKGGSAKKTLDQMAAEMMQKGVKLESPARRGFLGLGKAADFPLAKMDTKALERMQSDLKGAPAVTEKTVTVDPGKGAAKSTLKSVSETPMTRREVLQSAAGQAMRGVLPDLGGLNAIGNVAKVAETAAPTFTFDMVPALVAEAVRKGMSEEQAMSFIRGMMPAAEKRFRIEDMYDAYKNPEFFTVLEGKAGPGEVMRSMMGALPESLTGAPLSSIRPQIRAMRERAPEVYDQLRQTAKDIGEYGHEN